MAQQRLTFCKDKIEALIRLSDDAEFGQSASCVLSVYLSAFKDFSEFLDNGIKFMESKGVK